MNAVEWKPIAAKMVRRWFHVDWAKATQVGVLDQYLEDLADLPADQVAVAIEVLAREGREFPPPAGLIRERVNELAIDAPEWGEVCRAIARGCSLSAQRYHDGETYDDRAEFLAAQHPVVRDFVNAVGWREAALSGSDDRTAQAQVREKYLGFVRRMGRDAAFAGLPAAGLAAIARANGEPLQIGDAAERVLELLKPEEKAA